MVDKHSSPLRALLERFPANWTPVRAKKTRQNKNLEPRSDSVGTEKALGWSEPGLRHFCTASADSGADGPARLVVPGWLLCIIRRQEEQSCA